MYILLIFSNLIFSFLTKNKKIILFYLIVSYSLVIGLRYDVGIDYLGYEKYFVDKRNCEIGYNFLQNIIYYFNGQFYHLTILISFFMIFPIIYFLKNNLEKINELRIGIFLFLISDFTFSSMNLMRQSLATSFCFLSTDFYYKKKYKEFFILFLIGFSFHKSACIYILLFFILDKIRINRIFSIIFLILLFISRKFISFTDLLLRILKLVNIIYPQYSFDRINEYAKYTKANTSILNLGLLSLIILYILVVSNKEKYLKYYEKFMFISLFFRILSTQNFIFNRISLYFDLYIFLSVLMYYIQNKNKDIKKKIIFGISIFILSINFIKAGYFSSDSAKNKYKFIFYEKNLNIPNENIKKEKINYD